MGIGNSKATHSCIYIDQLYFDPEADQRKGKSYFIANYDLIETMSSAADVNEEILSVSIYTHPLSWLQVTDLYLFHAFVVFETEKYWWSVEKNSEGVTIQRSRKFEFVKDRYRGSKRFVDPLDRDLFKCLVKAPGKGSLEDLVRTIYKENLLGKYDYLTNNCKSFAARIFNRSSHGHCTVNPGVLGVLAVSSADGWFPGAGGFSNLSHPITLV